jgi:hypothetical protein
MVLLALFLAQRSALILPRVNPALQLADQLFVSYTSNLKLLWLVDYLLSHSFIFELQLDQTFLPKLC